MSFSFPKEIIITEEFTLRDETGNSITFNTNGTASSATSAGGIVTRTVTDPKFTSSAFVDLLNEVFNAGFVLEDDEYLTTSVGRNVFLERTGGSVNNFLSVLGNLNVTNNIDVSGNITSPGTLNIGSIVSSGQIQIGIGTLAITDKIDIDGGGYATNSTTEFKPISIGYECNITGGQNSTITLGNFSGRNDQKLQAIAIGNYAANIGQNQNSIAIGVESARNYQGTSSIAIGTYAGQNQQDNFTIALGENSGRNRQGEKSIAIGINSGFDNQLSSSISIGDSAGRNNQSSYSIAIGNESGKTSQQIKSIALGYYSASNNQSSNSIAIGSQAAENNQLSNSIAIGSYAGQNQQNINSIAIGNLSAQHNQSSESVAIGYASGSVNQGSYNVAIGRDSGEAYQATQSVAIGYHAGAVNQGLGVDNNYFFPGYSVAVGAEAGMTKQGNYSTALGYRAGGVNQGQLSVALGHDAGKETQGFNSVAVGVYSGENFQAQNCVSIGKGAARNNQQQLSIAIGLAAANTNQGSRCIAIGEYAGLNYQSQWSIAIGGRAARYNQATGSIAIGPYAGDNFQNTYSVSLGYESAIQNQSSKSIAIGYQSGKEFQNTKSIAIGNLAGKSYQSLSCVAVGDDSGSINQKQYSIAVGFESGKNNQGIPNSGDEGFSVAIGYKSGNFNQTTGAVAIGKNSGFTYQKRDCIAIGNSAGYQNQGNESISIGKNAGKTFQSTNAIAIGANSGENYQETECIAIGENAGITNQNRAAIAIGFKSGAKFQDTQSTAIGYKAGHDNQGDSAIAIGESAGLERQGDHSIAIGTKSGYKRLGTNSISIGQYSSGGANDIQPNNSISLNATGSEKPVSDSGSFYVNPVRNVVSDTNTAYAFIRYNWRNGEIFANNKHLDFGYTGSYNQKIRWNVTGVNNSNLTSETGPNQIQLWSDARYGFGIESHSVKYHSNINHNFYYYSGGNPSTTNGTRVLQLNYSNAIVTGNIAANGVSSPSYPLDFNGISHAGAEGFHSGKIIYYDRLDTNNNLSEVSNDISTFDTQGQVRFTGGACEILGSGHIITNTYDFRNYFGHGYFDRTSQDIRDNSVNRGEISTRILLKLNANFYSHDSIDEFFKIELYDSTGSTLIDTLYVGCVTERNNPGYIPIVCDLTQYITNTQNQFRFKFSQTANALGDYTFIKNFTICLDDSTSWYNFSTFNSNVINNLKIPVGTTTQRPTAVDSSHYGYIRYNTTTSSYEGFGAGNTWGSLGGIKDVDQDTYITAENSPGTDNDQLKFYTAGTEKMIINTNGDFGLNISNPTSKLHIYANNTTSINHEPAIKLLTNNRFNNTSGSSWSLISINGTSHPNDYSGLTSNGNEEFEQVGINLINYNTSGSGQYGINSRSKTGIGFTVRHNTTLHENALAISSDGNVGIGTTGPSNKLHVDTSTTYDGIILYNGNNELCKLAKDTNNAGYLQLKENNSAKVRFFSKAGQDSFINNGGNFGIGTSSPNAKLHVNGNIKCSGDLTVSGNDIIFGNGESIKNTTNNIIDIYATTTRLSGDLFLKKTGNNGGIIQAYDANHAIYIRRGYNQASNDYSDHLDFHEYGNIRFYTNGFIQNQTEKMRINQNGNVGIGTTTPSEKLSIGSGGNLQFNLDENLARDTTSAASALTYFKSKEQNIIRNANKNYRNSGDGGSLFDTHKIVLGYSDLNNMDTGGGGYYPKHHAIKFQMIPNWETGYDSVNNVYPAAGSIEPTTMMVINGDGNVGIGTESPNYNLDVSGDVHFSGAIIGESTYSKRFNFYSNDTQQIELTLVGGSSGFNNIYIELKVSAGAGNSSGAGTVHNYYLLKYYNTDVDANLIRSYKTPYSTSYHLASVSYVQSGTKIKIMVNPIDGYQQTVDGWIFVSIYSDGPTISATSHTTVTDAVTENSLVTSGRIALGGNVGIGTTSPSQKLHIHDGGFSVTGYSTAGATLFNSVTPGVHIGTHGSTATPYGFIELVAGNEAGSWIDFKDTTNNNTNADFEGRIRYGSGGSFAGMGFLTNSNERMRIATNGNVGIGTTAPEAQLELSKSGGTTLSIVNPDGFYDSQNQSIEFKTNYATVGFIQQESVFLKIGTTGTNPSLNTGIKFYTTSYDSTGGTTGTRDRIAGRKFYQINNPFIEETYNSTADNCQMIIDGNGNVGIGTTTPELPFEVVGNNGISNPNTNNLSNAIAKFTANDVAGVVIGSTNGNAPYIADCNGASTNSIGLRFLTQSQERIRITSAGNVGIGTNSPGELLETKGNIFLNNYSQNSNGTRTGGKLLFDGSFDVGGNGAEGPQKIDLYNKSGNYGFGVEGGTTTYFSANKHKWYTTSGSTTARMILDSDKLGIGTTTPSYNLDVAGDINFTGTLYQNGSAFSGGGGGSSSTSGFSVTGGGSTLNSTRSVGVHLATLTSGNVNGTEHSFIELVSSNDNGSWIDFKDSSSGNADREGRIRHGYGGTTNGLQFETAQTTRMHIGNNGNVGIGTTSPSNKLTINGSNNDTVPILGLTSGNGNNGFNNGAQIAFGFNGTNTYQHFIQTRHEGGSGVNNAIDFYVSDGTQNNTLTSGSTHTMTLRSGNVGIGTTSPSKTLHVAGTSIIGSGVNNITPIGVGDPSIQCKDIVLHNNSANDQMYIRRIGASKYQFQTGHNAGHLHLQPYGGNVGIGTTNPVAKLNIISGGLEALRINGTSYVSHFLHGTNEDVYIRPGKAAGNVMIADVGSNVGIGTISPAAKLDVNGSVRSAYDTDTTSYFGRTAIGYGGGHSNFAFFSHIDKSTDSGSYALKQNSGGGTYLNSATGKKIEFKINNQAKAVLDANGNFGIGTTGPQYKLHVIGEAFFNDTDAGSIRIHSNQINFEGINDQADNDDYAYIGRTNNDLHIVNGNNYDNDVRIYAASHPVTYSGGSDKGRVVVRNLSNNSDDRIKHNEEIITNALSDIRQLTPKKYWKLDDVLYDENHNFDLDTNGYPIDSSGNRVPAYIEHGLIAQEVLNIDSFIPFVGNPRANQDNSTYSLEYSNIFVHSIAAIKELDAAHSVTKQELEAEKTKTASLETKVTSLETQLAAVLARLDALENN